MEVFLRFKYNGKELTNGTILISGVPEQIFYVKLDEPTIQLLEKINEVYLYSKQREFIASDAKITEVKQVKSENKSYFPMFGTTEYDLLQSQNKPLKDVLTLEPGKRIILNVNMVGSPIKEVSQPYPVQGGRRKRQTRKNKRVQYANYYVRVSFCWNE